MSDQSWVPTDVDHAKKEYEDWEAGKTRTEKPPVGKSVWFVFPARRGASQGATPFRKGQYIHFVRDPENTENVLAVGLCPSKTSNEPCAICPFLGKLRSSGIVADKELAERMAAKEHIILNAARLDIDDPKPVILQIPATVYGDLNKILRDKNDGMDFTNPTKGRAVIIERTGTTKNDTKYTTRLGTKDIAIPNIKWLDEAADLDNVFESLDMESLKKTFAAAAAKQAVMAGGSAPSSSSVGAGETQRQLPASDPSPSPSPSPSRPGEIEMVEDPITGEMTPKKK